MHVGPLDQEYDRLVAHLSVDQLEPGMVLASDVMTGRGHKLIASGQELSDQHLQGLKTWGIARVEIQGDASALLESMADRLAEWNKALDG